MSQKNWDTSILVGQRQQIVVAGNTVSVNGSSVGCLNSTVGLVLTSLTMFHKEEFPLCSN